MIKTALPQALIGRDVGSSPASTSVADFSADELPQRLFERGEGGAEDLSTNNRAYMERLADEGKKFLEIPKEIRPQVDLLETNRRSRANNRDASRGGSSFDALGQAQSFVLSATTDATAGEKFPLAGVPPLGASDAEGYTHRFWGEEDDEVERRLGVRAPRTSMEVKKAVGAAGVEVELKIHDSATEDKANLANPTVRLLDPKPFDQTPLNIKSFFACLAKHHPDMKDIAQKRLACLKGDPPAFMNTVAGARPLNPVTQQPYEFLQVDWALFMGLHNLNRFTSYMPDLRNNTHWRLYEEHAIMNAAYNYLAQELKILSPSSGTRCLNKQPENTFRHIVDARGMSNGPANIPPVVRTFNSMLPNNTDTLYNANPGYTLAQFSKEWNFGGFENQHGWNRLPGELQAHLDGKQDFARFKAGVDCGFFGKHWPLLARRVSAAIVKEAERFGIKGVSLGSGALHRTGHLTGITLSFDSLKTTLVQSVRELVNTMPARAPPTSLIAKQFQQKSGRAVRIFGYDIQTRKLNSKQGRTIDLLSNAARMYFCDGLLALVSEAWQQHASKLTAAIPVPGAAAGQVIETFADLEKWMDFVFSMGGHSILFAIAAQAYNVNIFFAHQKRTSKTGSELEWKWYAPMTQKPDQLEHIPAFFFMATPEQIYLLRPRGLASPSVITSRVRRTGAKPIQAPAPILAQLSPESGFYADANTGAITQQTIIPRYNYDPDVEVGKAAVPTANVASTRNCAHKASKVAANFRRMIGRLKR